MRSAVKTQICMRAWILSLTWQTNKYSIVMHCIFQQSCSDFQVLSAFLAVTTYIIKLWSWKANQARVGLHTTLYGSAAGCRSIQKTCAFWKNGLTFENTQSQLTYFCKSNINQTFTNGNGMIWGVMIAIFTENQTLGRRIDHLFVFCWTSEIEHFDS